MHKNLITITYLDNHQQINNSYNSANRNQTFITSKSWSFKESKLDLADFKIVKNVCINCLNVKN